MKNRKPISRVSDDIKKAERICRELRSGKTAAIDGLYRDYHQFFLAIALRRLYEPDVAEDVLSGFWLEIIKSKAICAYEGKNNASLKTFLVKILLFRIIDQNRLSKQDRTIAICDATGGVSDPIERSEREQTIDKIIHESLLVLSQLHARNAELVRFHLRGWNHEEKAKRLLSAENTDCTAEELVKKTNAIKKQWSRPGGALAQFSLIVKRIMARDELNLEDFSA